MKKAEKLIPHHKPEPKRYHKRLVRRARRRAEKRDPLAPTAAKAFIRGIY